MVQHGIAGNIVVSGCTTYLDSKMGIVACSRADSTGLNLLPSCVDLMRAMKEKLEGRLGA